jgi:hypothetical protein
MIVNPVKRRGNMMKILIFLMDPDMVITFNCYRFSNLGTVLIMILYGAKRTACRCEGWCLSKMLEDSYVRLCRKYPKIDWKLGQMVGRVQAETTTGS